MTIMAGQLAIGDKCGVSGLLPFSQTGSVDEVNHRIANSLQLVMSMVAVETRGIVDAAARSLLETVQRRIGAIANVHRQLYQSQNCDRVDLGRYLVELGDMLEKGCGDVASGRCVSVKADFMPVTAHDASTIGILVSELVSNACKYAYAFGAPGTVRVVMFALGDSGYRLVVEDQGRGLSALQPPVGSGFGRQLITLMTSRLGAKEQWEDAQPGTRFVLEVAGR